MVRRFGRIKNKLERVGQEACVYYDGCRWVCLENGGEEGLGAECEGGDILRSEGKVGDEELCNTEALAYPECKHRLYLRTDTVVQQQKHVRRRLESSAAQTSAKPSNALAKRRVGDLSTRVSVLKSTSA